MPGKEIDESSNGCWRVLVFVVVLLVFVFALLLLGAEEAQTDSGVSLTALLLSTPTVAFGNESVNADQRVPVMVLDEGGKPFEPFSELVVRVSDTPYADNGRNGQLQIQPCGPGQVIRIWAPGHEIKSVPCTGGAVSYQVSLTKLEAFDNPYYNWMSASADCNMCHGNQVQQNVDTGASFNEVNEWLRSGHAKVFTERYFETMYRGTTISGKMSSPVKPVIIGNSLVPVPPDATEDYHGPGFMLDFPQQPGNCAFCHAPAAVLASQEGVSLASSFPNPGGAFGEGVTCDVCHKVFDITLDDNGFPFENRPGVLSYQFMRPQGGIFMTGPFSNNLTMKDGATANHRLTCSPVFSRSEFCAPCHFGKFGDMVIYNSYGEWRSSPYAANPADPGYRTCQDCHMSHMGAADRGSLWSERQACSAENTRFQNFDHSMMDVGRNDQPLTGIDLPLMVQNAADIALFFDSHPTTGTNALDVLVGVTNTQAGHKFPTDSPLRHLILLVEAVDRVNTPLMQVAGDRLPTWAGPGPGSPTSHVDALTNNGVEDYSGRPGRAFANLLVEEETNLSPGMAYWNETKHAFENVADGTNSDNRLRPHQTDTSTYSFAMPDAGDVRITVKLMYRYAFFDLLVQKEWFERPDIVVAIVQCQGPPAQPEVLRQSCQKIGPQGGETPP